MSGTVFDAMQGAAVSRRTWLGLAISLAMVGSVQAAGVVLAASVSLRDELALALLGGNPLVVMVSLGGCPFCRQARDSYLGPLREQQGVHVVQLDMRSDAKVLDFNGGASTHDRLVRAWSVNIAPTVMFFGRDGREVAQRLVGGTLTDFYGAYLDDRLAQARTALNAK